MADELRIDTTVQIKRLFKREDDEHLGDAFLYPLKAAALPGPELRAYQIDDRNAEAVKMSGQPQVYIWEVDEYGHRGLLTMDGTHEATILGVDEGCVPKDFSDAHVSHIFGADDPALAGCLHLTTAKTEERGGGVTRREIGN